MKKIIPIFICLNIFTIGLFSSCDLLMNSILGSGSNPYEEDIYSNTYTSEMVTTNTLNEVYIAQVNVSSNVVPLTNVAYVDTIHTVLSADDNYIEKKTINAEKCFEQILFEQNKRLLESAEQYSRAVNDDTSVYDTKDYKLGETKLFYSQHSPNSHLYDKITAKCIYNKYNRSESQCYVFVDEKEYDENLLSLYQNLGNLFNQEYDTITSVLGSPKYSNYIKNIFVPCSKKIFILLTDIFNDKDGDTNKGVVLGYFSSADLFTEQICTKQNAKTNQCEMFYIDSWALENMELQTYSTLFHEFNHMINYVNKTLASYNSYSNRINNEIWYTEMLSMLTEDYIEERLGIVSNSFASTKSRLNNFNTSYNKGFLDWDEISDSLTAYANTYAYGAYLIRNFGGLELLKQIAQNTLANEESITAALQVVNPDCYYINDLVKTKIDFNYTVRKFYNVILNIEVPKSSQNSKNFDDRYFSLNIEKDYDRVNKLGFEAIDLNNLIFYINENMPFKYDPPTIKSAVYNQRKPIGPGGFLVQKVAQSNCYSFSLNYKPNQKGILEYYLITY